MRTHKKYRAFVSSWFHIKSFLQILIWEFWQEPKALDEANWTITGKKIGLGLEPKPHEGLSAITLLNCSQQNSWVWRLLKTPMQAQSTVIDHIIFWARQRLGLEHFSPPTHVLDDWWSYQTSPGLLTAWQGPENSSSYQGSQSQNRIRLCADKS